jgi:hypothetical protein
MIEEIKWEGKCFAIIVSNDFDKEGITFFTPNEFSQQMAFMKHPKNKNIEPHFHNSVSREVHFTNEVGFSIKVILFYCLRVAMASRFWKI